MEVSANGTGKPFSPELVEKLAQEMVITFKPEANANRVFVDGTEVTEAIRSPEVTAVVSKVSAVGGVRAEMVNQQRRMGEAGGVVMAAPYGRSRRRCYGRARHWYRGVSSCTGKNIFNGQR